VFETLDIFKVEDGMHVWKTAAESFEVAMSKVEQLATAAPGDYVIFDQTTGNEAVVRRHDRIPVNS
jgi:hypothetical protein